MTHEDTILPTIEQSLTEIYLLGANESKGDNRWIDVDSMISKLVTTSGFDHASIANIILRSNRHRWNFESDGNVRDCAFSILGRLDPRQIHCCDMKTIHKAAAASALNDPHIFTSGRAADLIRLWSEFETQIPKLDSKGRLTAFKSRAKQMFIDGGISWLDQYREDIPDLYNYLSGLT